MGLPRLLLLAPLLTACMTAEMIRRPDAPAVAFAPENEVGTGEIKYLNAGADSIREDRRADAYRQMFEACGGKYRIDSESDSADMNMAGAILVGPSASQSAYRHIRFSCTTAPKARLQPARAPTAAELARAPTAAELARAQEDEAARGAAFGRSKFTGAKEVVDAEDKLRVRAAKDLGCEPGALRVGALEAPDVPAGWAADVAGCEKVAVYFFGRDGWVKQPPK